MRILLFALNASHSHSNLAIRCLRPPLEQEGHEVVLLERTLRDRTAHILEELWRADAEVYGFSCYIWNLTQMLSLSRDLHAIRPHAKIILGGPEVSYAARRFEAMAHIDCIISGEGESILPTACRMIGEGKPLPRVMYGNSVPTMPKGGSFYRKGETSGALVYYESSRGCPYSCAYCLSSATHGLRMKGVEETLSELLEFEALDANVKTVKLVDRTFNADIRRANAIWRALLEERFTKTYHFEVCATLLNEESFDILSRFPVGKVQLEFGLQSTNPETLAACARHIDPAQVISAVRRIYEMGNIHVHLDLIAGLPYESYARFAKSFDDAYGCSHMLQLGFLKLLYGTELRNRAEEYGYRCQGEPPYTVLESKWITYEELQRLSHIAEVLERYVESGRFTHALWYLEPRMPSPFRFWEGFADYLSVTDSRPLQRISQPDAYRYFAEYAKTLPYADSDILRSHLAADFEMHENKRAPVFLR